MPIHDNDANTRQPNREKYCGNCKHMTFRGFRKYCIHHGQMIKNFHAHCDEWRDRFEKGWGS